MQIALHLNVEVIDDTLVLKDGRGKTIRFAKEQTIQKQVIMVALGEFSKLPKRQIATCFGFKSRTSYYDIRNTVLKGESADLLPKRTGPRSPSKRTKALEALIIRTRFETDGSMYEIAEELNQLGVTVSTRLVGQVLADYGLSKKTADGEH